MVSAANTTSITPPRVQLTDPLTGMINREWYRFFVNLFNLTGSGQNDVTLEDLQIGPDTSNNLSAHQIAQDLQALSLAPTYVFSDRMGPEYVRTRAVTASDSFRPDDYIVLCDATAGVVTLTLPAAAASQGRKLVAKKTDASANAVTVDGNGAETVDGAASVSITARYDSVSVISDGTTWWIT
jgi:hypothetical protein